MAMRSVDVDLATGRTSCGDPIIGGEAGSPGSFSFSWIGWSDFAQLLVSQYACANTKTSTMGFSLVLPLDYVAGTDLELAIHARVYLLPEAVLASSTFDAQLCRLTANGEGATDLVTTAAQTFSEGWADYAFDVNGAALAPGDRVLVILQTVVQETGGEESAIAHIGEVKLNLECEDGMNAQEVANINVDSTGGTLTLAKALEAIVARCVGDLAYDSQSGVVTFYGRDGQTPVATVKLTGGGVRQDSNIP
ncbi:MAG: hypothetical protein MUP47_10760 [Phycisphaerae bacterium]|nr:hypothetical protein [Phycisphaerae bacterium]